MDTFPGTDVLDIAAAAREKARIAALQRVSGRRFDALEAAIAAEIELGTSIDMLLQNGADMALTCILASIQLIPFEQRGPAAVSMLNGVYQFAREALAEQEQAIKDAKKTARRQ